PEAADVHFAQSPVLGDRVVIARRTDGLVLAYAPDLQREVWRHVCPADHDTRHTGALSEQTYVFAAGKIVRALDARSGKLLWEWSAGDAVIYANPAVADGRVFVGSWSGTFVALDLRSGREMWSHAQQFKYGHTSPVVVDGNVVMGDRGGHVRCFDPKNGRVRWEERFGATGLSTPGHAPGRLLLGFGRSAAQWDLKTGRELQPLIGTGSNAFGSPTMVGKNFYFGNLDGHLYAHDAKKGELLWQFRVPGFVEVQGRRGAQGGRGAKGRRRPHAALDFVHTGTRIFASTSNGLYCLVQDPEKRGKRPFGVTIKPD
ncbi:MAG: PQQ-binding-like beta-propeller repeat protein, partial [Planctomycetota bacterium]